MSLDVVYHYLRPNEDDPTFDVGFDYNKQGRKIICIEARQDM
jgi:hypothetical protein